jgi:plasmid stability protein
MANLSVRKLDNAVYERLRVRAAKHGVSMEEEARQIIYQAVAAPERISEVFHKYFSAQNGLDLDELNLRNPHELWI